MICIYKITNPVGQIYVGATMDFDRRRKTYRNMSQLLTQRRIRESIITYGYHNHSFKVLEECKKEELDLKEQCWIAELNSVYPNGLNQTMGGKGNKGVKLTKAHKKRLSQLRSIPVFQYDLDGKYLNKYKSAYDAQHKTGIYFCDIRACVTHIRNRQTAGGFFWSDQRVEKFNGSLYRSKRREVVQMTETFEPIGQFDNLSDAANKTGVDATNISRVCNGSRQIAGGYRWKFKDQMDKL